MAISHPGANPALDLLKTTTVSSLFYSPLLFLAFGGWLLHPFSFRHAFNRKFPPRLRGAIAFVSLTAALPLGGLAAPFWIYARHRIWPRYEPLLSQAERR